MAEALLDIAGPNFSLCIWSVPSLLTVEPRLKEQGLWGCALLLAECRSTKGLGKLVMPLKASAQN
jgi:hypothetical protein